MTSVPGPEMPPHLALPGRSRAARVGAKDASRAGRQQAAESHNVVRGSTEGEDPVHQSAATMPQFAKPADGLDPSKGLLDELALALTDGIARMARRAAIDAAAPLRGVLCHMRRDVHLPQGRDECRHVVPFVHPQGDAAPARPSVMTSAASRSPYPSAGKT